MRRLIPLLLLPLLTGPVLAQTAGLKPSPAALHPGSLPGPACVPVHRQALEAAMAEARPRLVEAIAFLRARPDHPHVQRWFGTAPRRDILARFARIAARLGTLEGLKLACNDRRECGPAFAYTVRQANLLGLCPRFFGARAEGYDSRWGVLIHEASHLAAGTSDHAYGRNSAAHLARVDPARAASNADNYEYFVETLPR